MQILLVDGDDEFRRAVDHRLTGLGHHVFDAPTAEEALRLADRERIEVALIDVPAPGMNGIELLERLKATTLGCEVVLLTDEATIETVVLAMKRGAFDYLTKPRSVGEIENVLNKAYEHYQLSKVNRQLPEALERNLQSGETLADAERRHVKSILKRQGYNRVRTAQTLGISRRSLYRLIAKYDIQTPGRGSSGSENPE